MYISEIQIRVRYAETDQMGYVYYGNYAVYFEVGRVEALRKLGFSYKKIEEDGIMLPVISFNIKYIKPAFYDELLTLKTFIKEIPQTKIKFEYESYNEKNILINTGETELVFIDKKTNRICKAPEDFINNLKNVIK